MEYSLYICRFAKIEVLRLGTPVTPHDTECLFAPQKQKLAKARRESETQRMTTMTTTMKTMIKSKTENESLPSYPSSPTNPNVHPPTTRTAFVIHVYPPALSSFYWGKTVLDGWAKWSCPPPFFSSHPMELRATQHPPPHPTHSPEVLRQPSTQHSTISLSTPLYVFPCEDFGTGI